MRKNIKKEKHSPRYVAAQKEIEVERLHGVEEAITLVKKNATAKFVEGIDLAVKLGIDPRKGDQNVRGTTNLPFGTGKTKKVAVLASGDQAAEAKEAGADVVGDEDLIKQIQEGFRDFDVMLASTDMAPQIGKIGKFLGPRTPNKRNGTVTNAIGQAVKEIKGATRVEYRAEKAGIIHMPIGKASFTEEQLGTNFRAAMDAIVKAKPQAAKGKYILSVTVSSTMGPAVHIDSALAAKAPTK